MFIELTSIHSTATKHININQIHIITSRRDATVVSTSQYIIEVKESREEVLTLINKSRSTFTSVDISKFNPFKLKRN